MAANGACFPLANEACGVLNAATRKYLTADHLWYYPPVEAFVKMAEYANRFGTAEGRPYFSLDGKSPISAKDWARMRAKFLVSWALRTSGASRKLQASSASRATAME